MHRFFLLILFSILLSSCTLFPVKAPASPSPIATQAPTAEDVLKGDTVLALVMDGSLTVVDPDFGISAPVYTLQPEETPPLLQLNSFLISPTKQFIVWYTPTKGLLVFTLSTKAVSVLSPPSDWFNTHPYFAIHPKEDVLYFMGNDGRVFHRYNLSESQDTTITIPYPFGTRFSLSPDALHVLFVSGYLQSPRPEYLFLHLPEGSFTRYSTTGELSERHIISWVSDSSGVVMPSSNTLLFYPVIDPENPQLVFTFPDDQKITDLQQVDGLVFANTSEGTWHVINPAIKKEQARIPASIAQELYQPQFVAWSAYQFLLEETLANGPETSKRLWLSDLKGVKKMVLRKYHSQTVETNTPTF
jgi:hypothetical protein